MDNNTAKIKYRTPQGTKEDELIAQSDTQLDAMIQNKLSELYGQIVNLISVTMRVERGVFIYHYGSDNHVINVETING